ncbi:PTS system, lactose-specific IIBC component [Staphylococcus aureus]|nr:PTS system, lactose-specific IIBC component [Staphylococcus aureus]
MMQKLIAQIEKGKPFFEKLSRNIYLRAIRDGFISAMPVILFSSIFLSFALFWFVGIHGPSIVEPAIEQGEDAAREWLRTTGFKNIDDLNKVLKDTATSWKQRK